MQNRLKFITERGVITTMLCAKLRNKLMGKRDFLEISVLPIDRELETYGYVFSIVGTDDLVLKYQAIGIYSAN